MSNLKRIGFFTVVVLLIALQVELGLTYTVEGNVVTVQDGSKGFTANPTFFAARSKEQRCNALNLWIQSILYEGRLFIRARPGYSKFNGNEEDIMYLINRDVDKQYLALLHFQKIFGNYLHELSDNQRSEISKSLEKCVSNEWVGSALIQPLKLKLIPHGVDDLRYWVRMSKNLQTEEEEAKTQKSVVASDQERGYFEGEILLETNLYRLQIEGRFDWCETARSKAFVAMIFKVDEHYEIKDNDEYWTRFRNEILPIVSRRCSSAQTIHVYHHVANVYIQLNRIRNTYDSGLPNTALSNSSFNVHDQTHEWRYYETGLYNGLPADPSATSVASIRAFIERAYKLKAAQNQAWYDEQKRKQDQEKLAELQSKRVSHRAKAESVLELVKLPSAKPSPDSYSFSGYRQKDVLQKVYEGDFETFTGGYEPQDYLQAMLKSDLDTMLKITGHRLPVAIAFVAYQKAYQSKCFDNKEIPWTVARFRRGEVVTRNWLGIEVGRMKGESFEFPVREPFSDSFKRTYGAADGDPLGQLMSGVPLTTIFEFDNDFQKFLVAEKCSSPALRHFEVNLYLANEWLLPLKELQKP